MLEDFPFTADEVERLRSLLGGGDSEQHYHSSDRTPTHDTVTLLETQKNSRDVDSDGPILYTDDYLYVDSTAAIVTLTLPVARGGNVFTVVRIAGGNDVVVQRTAPDTVDGGADVTLSSSYVPQRLKARKGTGYISV